METTRRPVSVPIGNNVNVIELEQPSVPTDYYTVSQKSRHRTRGGHKNVSLLLLALTLSNADQSSKLFAVHEIYNKTHVTVSISP